MNKFFQNKKGTSILLVLLILTSILTISLAVSGLVVSGLRMGRTQARSTKAFFAAESGVEKTLWEIRQNGFDLSTGIIPPGSLADGSVYNVSSDTGISPAFISLGNNYGVRRAIRVSFDYSTGSGGGTIP